MLSKTANRILRKREQILNSGKIVLCSKSYSQEVNVVKSKLPQLDIPNILIDEYVWRNLDKWHDKTALVSCIACLVDSVMILFIVLI